VCHRVSLWRDILSYITKKSLKEKVTEYDEIKLDINTNKPHSIQNKKWLF
jgi:hypothetical protein